jgi:hypothetical protein
VGAAWPSPLEFAKVSGPARFCRFIQAASVTACWGAVCAKADTAAQQAHNENDSRRILKNLGVGIRRGDWLPEDKSIPVDRMQRINLPIIRKHYPKNGSQLLMLSLLDKVSC